MNEWIMILIMVPIALIIIDLSQGTYKDKIKRRIEESGGVLISVDKKTSYIREVYEFFGERKYNIHYAYKANYEIAGEEKILYLVLYKDFFMPSKVMKEDWIEIS